MLIPDRHRHLLDAVRRSGSVQVAQISAELGISASTVRRDLAQLEAEGHLRRTRGGAYAPGGLIEVPPGRAEDPQAGPVKARIGQAAAARIADGATVMILEGSTTGAMLAHLEGRTITVVTNGLRVAAALQHFPTVSVIMLGGLLNREHMTFLGPMSEQSLQNLHLDAIYAGAWGITAEAGVTGDKIVQAGYHHIALAHTDSLVVLADASKFDRLGPTVLAAPEQITTLITDTSAPQAALDGLRGRGVDVVLC